MNPLNGIIVILSSVLSLFGLGTGAISQVQATRQMISPPAQIQPLNPQQLCQPPMQPQFLDSPPATTLNTDMSAYNRGKASP
jgi:hypothetical protein